MRELKIGNRDVSMRDAKNWVSEYTSAPKDLKKPFGFPWYDRYDTGNSNLLVESDLLAPVLLNVRISIAAFASLSRITPELNKILETIDTEAALVDSDDLLPIHELFAVIDDCKPFGVLGTTLAKVLHRKRPGFIPLYDSAVESCLLSEHNHKSPRLETSRSEPWGGLHGTGC